jgi:signal transduction histidine kinase
MGEPARHWRGHVASMRLRVTLAASLVTAVAVALAGWLLIRSVESTQLNHLRERAETSVATVADRLEAGHAWPDALVDLPSVVFITDEAGLCVASNPAGGGTALQCTGGGPGAGSAVAGEARRDVIFSGPGTSVIGQGAPVPTGSADGTETAMGAERFSTTVDSNLYGTLTITAIAPSDEVARGVDAVGRVLWVLLPGLVAVVALVAWWLSGRALRPVEAIRVEAEAIGGATIDRRLPEPASDDEIGRLARTMNAMLERLEQSARRQRQFVSDASHELRSPVTAIRTDLEVALQEGDGADWRTVAHAVLAEEGRLETLLGDLLVLASDDETTSAAAHTATVDLALVAAEEAARVHPVPVTLELTGDEDLEAFVVAGVAPRLGRAVTNLVDNACRHAGSQVRVSLHRQGERVRLLVDDDGAGVPPADRERIFERFTRLDDSRTRDRGGAGLGLAVVRSIVTRHGGFVWADQSPLGGARFTVELPAATAA